VESKKGKNMKEELKDKLFQEGKESFSFGIILLGNIAFLLNWGIGFVLLMPFRINGIPIVSWIYLIILIIVQLSLKKLNCTSCYYYGKSCYLGWGKLAALCFKQDSGNQEKGMKLAISYVLQLPIILIATLIAGFIYGFNTLNIILLIIFVIINILQGAVLRKKACTVCKSRFICKGSAAPK